RKTRHSPRQTLCGFNPVRLAGVRKARPVTSDAYVPIRKRDPLVWLRRARSLRSYGSRSREPRIITSYALAIAKFKVTEEVFRPLRLNIQASKIQLVPVHLL